MNVGSTKRVAVIGFGYIGSVIGATLATRGCTVIGVDRDASLVETVMSGRSPFAEETLEERIVEGINGGTLRVTTDVSEVAGSDVYVITVGTPLNELYEADIDHVQQAWDSIEPYVSDGALVIVKSTVPPHTTEAVIGTEFEGKNIDVAFCPERLAEGHAISEFESIPIIVGGLTEQATQAAKQFWESVLDVEVMTVSNALTAEMVKLADNLWIDMNIALAGELAKLSDVLGIDVVEVIEAANTLPKGSHHVNILLPSVGVGGYCLTKDPWFVHQFGHNRGIELRTPVVSREVNDSMPLYSAGLVDELLKQAHPDTEQAKLKVAVLGAAFKTDTGDCRFTPTVPFINTLVARGYEVVVCDPLVSAADAKKWFGMQFSPSIDDTMRDADCVAILAAHTMFRELTAGDIASLAKPGALVFDGRRFYTRAEINELRAHGLKYKGVGRV